MSVTGKRLTSTEVVLLAAFDLSASGQTEFSEWHLSEAAWKRDQNRFGMRGFEPKYPDHKRVMKEIMGKTSAVHRGLLEKTRPNYYRLTAVGRAEVARLGSGQTGSGELRSISGAYDDLVRFVDHHVFKSWLKDGNEPRTWLGAAAFLGLTKHDPNELNNRLREPLRLAADGLAWMDENQRDHLTRGPVGGGKAVSRHDLQKVREFVELLQTRFATQIGAIQRRGEQPGA
jgi:hypothetical protein